MPLEGASRKLAIFLFVPYINVCLLHRLTYLWPRLLGLQRILAHLVRLDAHLAVRQCAVALDLAPGVRACQWVVIESVQIASRVDDGAYLLHNWQAISAMVRGLALAASSDSAHMVCLCCYGSIFVVFVLSCLVKSLSRHSD